MKAIDMKNFLQNFSDDELRRVSIKTVLQKTNFPKIEIGGMSFSDPTTESPLGEIYLYEK